MDDIMRKECGTEGTSKDISFGRKGHGNGQNCGLGTVKEMFCSGIPIL